MNKYTILAVLALSLSGCQKGGAMPRAMNVHAGVAYEHAIECALSKKKPVKPPFIDDDDYLLASNDCRDLTDEELEEAENKSGGGYSDGQWQGENPPKEEDYMSVQHVFEDDDGNIIIIDDDGEIIVLSWC